MITVRYTTWQSMGGGVMTSAPTVAARRTPDDPREIHDVFYLNEQRNAVGRTVINGVAGPEIDLGGVFYAGSTVAAVWRFHPVAGARLDLFARGTESALWQKTFDRGRWGAWTARTGPGALTSDPAVAGISLDRLDVFYRGAGRDLQQTRPCSTDRCSVRSRWAGTSSPDQPWSRGRPGP